MTAGRTLKPMATADDTERTARAVIDANLYMTLGTVDANGRPWVTPVFFAGIGTHELFWVSDLGSAHSRNLEVQPQLAIVIFDSRMPLETEGYGVYLSAVADRPAGAARDRGLEVLTRRSEAHGGRTWTPERVEPPAPVRLYRAVAQTLHVWPEIGAWDR